MSSHVTSPGQDLSQYKVEETPRSSSMLLGELLVSHSTSFTEEESSVNLQNIRHRQASSSLAPPQPSHPQIEMAS